MPAPDHFEAIARVVMEEAGLLMLASPSTPTTQLIVAWPSPTAMDADATRLDLSIEVDDVEEAYERAVSHGFEIVRPLGDEPWGVQPLLRARPDRPRRQCLEPHRVIATERPAGYVYSEDVVFTDPDGSVRGRASVEDKAAALLGSVPSDFVFAEDGARYVAPDIGALAWALGPAGAPVARGIDIITVTDGAITAVRTFFVDPARESAEIVTPRAG